MILEELVNQPFRDRPQVIPEMKVLVAVPQKGLMRAEITATFGAHTSVLRLFRRAVHAGLTRHVFYAPGRAEKLSHKLTEMHVTVNIKRGTKESLSL